MHSRWITAVVAASATIMTLNMKVVTIALPDINGDLEANLSDAQWIVNGYVLVFAALLLGARALPITCPVTASSSQGTPSSASLRCGLSVHQVPTRCGMHSTAAYAVATEAGCHIRLTRYARKVRQTQLRVEYLRLRLASLSIGDAGIAVGIHRRSCLDFEKRNHQIQWAA